MTSNSDVRIEAMKDSDEFMVVLPEKVISELDWRVGDSVEVDASRGRITLTNKSRNERKVSLGAAAR